MNDKARPTVNVSIDVSDLESGLAFYESVFGWKERARPFPTMAVLDANNVMVCLHAKAEGSKPTPSAETRHYERHWTPVHLDLHVPDYEATLKRAKDAGATIEREFTKPKGTAFCSDPFGNGFCIIQA